MGTYTIKLTPKEETALKNDLLDINDWIQEAITGKVNNCKKRMVNEWRPILFADESVSSIPANDDDFIALVVTRSDYKTRSEREAELASESE
jgi:hypothetical protein